jgi:phytoene desaturase
MPDVFEKFFARFGKKPSDYYELVRLDPSYQVIWKDESVAIPASMNELKQLFEHYEAGSGARLKTFLEASGQKYQTAMAQLVYQPGLSVTEFMRGDVLRALFSMDLLQSIHKYVRKYFSHPKLLQLVEFPILFLGALPQNTPALYTLMNYADMALGTWYPLGGMARIVKAMYDLATSLGVRFRFNEPVASIHCERSRITSVQATINSYKADIVIAACDYHHSESLLPPAFRNY